jgi:hypothetical protein
MKMGRKNLLSNDEYVIIFTKFVLSLPENVIRGLTTASGMKIVS